MINLACLLITLLCPLIMRGQKSEPLPITGPGVTGTLLRYPSFPSKFVDAREVDVWLPADYERNKTESYPALYMQDGQNLFDASRNVFNHSEWGVDETMTRLIAEKRIPPAIVVGIWNNTSKRSREYMPQKAATWAQQKDGSVVILADEKLPVSEIVSDKYLRFMVEELKPFIDAKYRTKRAREYTFVMGSSLGGLISAYAISEYPQVYGGAACMSTHWPAGEGAMIQYLKGHLPDPRLHRIYFDFGTEALDQMYEPYQLKMDEVMKSAGYTLGENWETQKFPGASHSEESWGKRLEVPLTFLLEKQANK